MAVPEAFDFRAILAQLASDFLLPHADISAGYTAEQLDALWNPVLPGATEERIQTNLGFLNITHGGKLDGPSLVFWPSLMMRGSMWSYQYEHFRATHQVILIDSPGINKSDPLRKYIDLADCAKAVVAILDALGIEKCVFCGNSWGAMLAAVLPAYLPERLLGSIVINGTASLPSTAESVVMTVRAETLMLNATVPDWWVACARQAFAGHPSGRSNVEFVAYCRAIVQEDPKSIAWALRGILLGRTDTHALLGTIKNVPVLVIAGGEDGQFGIPMCKSLADAIPTSKFVVAPGVGHLASRENPVLINGMIEVWLNEISAVVVR